MRKRIERLISDRLYFPVFQPIVDIQRAQIAGFETLTRLKPESGFDNPGALFDAAERFGMLWQLEAATRHAAFESARDWKAGVQLFLNCSPQVFADRRFADEVHTMVMNTPGLTPGRVVLEITERSGQEYIEGLAQQVAVLKERGFQIAIDDVGAGTSGLNRIMRLRPHWLKLDRDLIESIDKDRVKQNLIRFLVHFARLSGVKIIAEGVERSEELAVLMDLGIIHAQGYYLGRPGGRDLALGGGVTDWLRQRWTDVQSCRLSRPLGQRIGRLMQSAKVFDASMPVGGVAAEFRAWSETVPGAVVVEGTRCVGWVDRDWTIERGSGEQAGYPIGSLLQPGAVVVGPEDPVTDVIDQLSTRDVRAASHPLIVFEDGKVLGIVAVTDVLCAVAELTKNPLVRTTPITGMPGRVRADEHLATMISRSAGLAPTERHDAAFIDIRHFADYNGAFGYELGDQLLQELCAAIRLEMLRTDHRIFVAHLGDDRFLITAARGIISQRIAALIARFEQSAVRLSASPMTHGQESGTGVGLRIILIDDAVSRISDARELFRMGNRIREAAAANPSAGQAVGQHSRVLKDSGEVTSLRLSA